MSDIEWKYVDGTNGRYQVSSTGQVRGPSGKILKPAPNNKGYPSVHIYYKPKSEARGLTKTVHRLVANAFIPNPLELKTVNHKDGNKANNAKDNLEWCSNRDNMRHAFQTGLNNQFGENNSRSKLSICDVVNIRTRLRNGESVASISRAYPVSHFIISQIKHGKLWDYPEAYPKELD